MKNRKYKSVITLIYFSASILLQNFTLPTSKPNLPLFSWVNTSLQPGLLLCSAVPTSPPRVTRFTLFCCLQSQEVSVLSSAGSLPISSAHISLAVSICSSVLITWQLAILCRSSSTAVVEHTFVILLWVVTYCSLNQSESSFRSRVYLRKLFNSSEAFLGFDAERKLRDQLCLASLQGGNMWTQNETQAWCQV